MKTIKFMANGQTYPLAIPGDKYALACAVEIVEGRSYPFPEWIGEPEVVVDIGGHAGEYAALASRIWPQALVHCYEPNPIMWPYLDKNAERFGFTIHKAAVGPMKTRAKLWNNEFGTVACSLMKRKHSLGQYIEVDVASATSVMELHPSVLKIDAEEYEVPILGSCIHYPADDWKITDVGMIHLEYHSQKDRRLIDDMLITTHNLWFSRSSHSDQGEVTYIRSNEDGQTDVQ